MDNVPLIFHSYVKEDFNKTTVQDFILIAFSSLKQLQILLFLLVLMAYLICISGNITIFLLVRTEPSLHTPMYFFISTFAVLEVLFVTVTIPNLLNNLISGNKRISRIGCFTQLFIFNGLGMTECYLLLVMTFDRDLAINNPLGYSAIMNKELCAELAVAPWVAGFAISSLTTGIMSHLKFCGVNQIDHFLCDLTPLPKIACSDPFMSKIATLLAAIFAIVFPIMIFIAFYVHIIYIISKIRGIDGKRKAFSTCSSHLIVAGLFFGAALIVYIRPDGSQDDKFLALIYTVLTPALNPFIYTLRNKDVKSALKKSIKRMQAFYRP